jgi:serine/threonine-protein kinase
VPTQQQLRQSGSGSYAAVPPQAPSGSGEHAAAGGGRKLGAYTLGARLGDEKSSVYQANGPKGACAVKILPQQVAESSPTAGKRFLREARSLFGLEHPNLVRSFDAGEELGTYFLAMDYVQGQTLADVLRNAGGKLSEVDALKVMTQVARAVAALQEKGLVHRNIKPAHILVDQQRMVKLVGMGLIRSSGDAKEAQVTGAGVIVGTPQYMSPEQALAKDLDSRSDLYSLGVSLYECLAGEPPFYDKVPSRVVARLVKEEVPHVHTKAPEVTQALAAVLERLLAKDPGDRYEEAEDVVGDLEAIQTNRLENGLPPSFGGSKPKKSKGRKGKGGDDGDATKKLMIVVGVLVAVVIVLVIALVAGS